MENNIDKVRDSTHLASQWLDEQLTQLKTELGDSELALHDYKKDNRILSASLDHQSNRLLAEMQQLSESLTRADVIVRSISRQGGPHPKHAARRGLARVPIRWCPS